SPKDSDNELIEKIFKRIPISGRRPQQYLAEIRRCLGDPQNDLKMLRNYFVFAFGKTVAMQYCSRIESGSVDKIAKDLEDNWQFYAGIVNTQDSAVEMHIFEQAA
ncbi:hypothetical protein Ciccas_011490, partial [Cichlidogyrus casuarinus]